MGHPRFSAEEIARRGQEWYDRSIRSQVEGRHDGQVVVIDIETGAFEVGEDSLEASHRAMAKHPGAALFGVRVGHEVVEEFGGFSPTPVKQ